MYQKTTNNTSSSHATDHMANERTFLAWIRTSIAIIAFGFFVEKFSLFIKQIASCVAIQSFPAHSELSNSSSHYSSIFGIFLVGLGTLMSIFSLIQDRKTEKQIQGNNYHFYY